MVVEQHNRAAAVSVFPRSSHVLYDTGSYGMHIVMVLQLHLLCFDAFCAFPESYKVPKRNYSIGVPAILVQYSGIALLSRYESPYELSYIMPICTCTAADMHAHPLPLPTHPSLHLACMWCKSNEQCILRFELKE